MLFRRCETVTYFIASAGKILGTLGMVAFAVTGDTAAQAAADKVTTKTGEIITYTNPLDVTIADPFVLQEGDTYYMYGTTDNSEGPGFDVYKSTDLVRWTRAAKCYSPKRGSFGSHSFWAPEVVKKDGKFYLHFTSYSREEERRNIIIARADSPEGPFEDYAGPIFPGSVIDSHVYHDDDSGDYFIYASPENVPPSRILGARLSDDFKQLVTSPTECLRSEFGWEDLWIEGPIIHKHNGLLYMLYSGGAWWESEYALGCATATSPLGPWTKYEKPVLYKTDEMAGVGHNGLAWSPDGSELFVIYHAHLGDYSLQRVAAMDRIKFEKQTTGPDTLTIPMGPSSSPQPIPSGAEALMTARSDEFSGDSLNEKLWHVYMKYPGEWSVAEGALGITAIDGDFWRSHDDGHNVFLQPIPTGDFSIETSVTMQSEKTNEQAFLTLWLDEENHVTLAGVYLNGPRFAITHEVKGKPDTSLALNDIGWPVCLRIEKSGNQLKFFASADGKSWKPIPRDVTIKGWTPRFVGLGAWAPGEERKTKARFDWFRVKRN